jgi:exopolyphosphatase/guanosine-5'-triphosphate,3'-diphosphate pyrophosphatase
VNPQRLAAIDIGSNSIRLVVAEIVPGGQFRILDEERESVRLGRALAGSGQLPREAIEAASTTLRRFHTIAVGLDASLIRVIATCAVREAENGLDLCRYVREQLGIEIEVISAYEEAQYAYLSVRQAYDLTDRNVAVADIGGGSTELVFATRGFIDEIVPTPLGAVRLAEMFTSSRLFGEDYECLTAEVDHILKQQIAKPPFVPQLLIGTGGTFTSLASVVLASRGQTSAPLAGFRCTRADVKHLIERLQGLSLKQRRNVAGLNADRADIIIPGLIIIDRVMRHLKVNNLMVHSGGVRDGLLWSIVLSQPPGAPEAHPELVVRRFAENCGVDWPHSRHVARLARQIFEQLVVPFGLQADDAPRIEVAGMLQDVGYLVNYDQHHKHTYHLICNSRLPGFHRRDLELIANIARYHRGAKPKQKHEHYSRLSVGEQQRVRQASAILRLAGGLDRSHSQQIQRVDVSVQMGKTRLVVDASGDPEVDLWAARRRASQFEKVFDTQLIILAQGTSAEATAHQPSEANEAGTRGELSLHGTERESAAEQPPEPDRAPASPDAPSSSTPVADKVTR